MNQEVYRSSEKKQSDITLDTFDTASRKRDWLCDSDAFKQDARHDSKMLQLSEEYIIIKDSCEVSVTTTDTKAALSLQASLQAVIALVISISIADSEKAEKITQDLLQTTKIKQITYQKLVIDNSRGVNVTTTDTQVAVNIQILLQILLALLAKLNIL